MGLAKNMSGSASPATVVAYFTPKSLCGTIWICSGLPSRALRFDQTEFRSTAGGIEEKVSVRIVTGRPSPGVAETVRTGSAG